MLNIIILLIGVFVAKASSVVELSSDFLIKDGKKLALTCPLERIEVSGSIIELNCVKEATRRVFLKLPDTKDLKQNIAIQNEFVFASQSGDAGDAWEYQSLIFKDGSLLKIKRLYNFVHFTSFECGTMTQTELKAAKIDCAKPGHRCEQIEEFFIWDGKSLPRPTAYFKSPTISLTPAEFYGKNCKK